jgi:hypothetical protein
MRHLRAGIGPRQAGASTPADTDPTKSDKSEPRRRAGRPNRRGKRSAFSQADRAALDRELADLYRDLGCVKEAKGLYQQAATIAACYAGPGAPTSCRGAYGDAGDEPCTLLDIAPPPAIRTPLAS